jgi:large subunit ribosomal protein L4
MKATVYKTDGKESGKVDLPESVFGLSWNGDLVHQVIVSMETNARVPYAHTKDRSEKRGGGKKPWRQKGTGRARHGSRRSPLWIGGGVTFGPRNEKNFDRKVNKKMKAKALFTILSKKLKDDEIIFVDNLDMKAPKTKDAKAIIDSLSTVKGYETLKTKRKNKAIVAIDENDVMIKKSFSNFSNVLTNEFRNLSPVELLKYKYVIIENPEKNVGLLEAKMVSKKITKKKIVKKDASVKKTVAKKIPVKKKVAEKKLTKKSPASRKATQDKTKVLK